MRRSAFSGSTRFASTRLAWLMVSTAAVVAWQPGIAASQEVKSAQPVRTFAIPAGPLSVALNRFADSSGLQMVYSSAIARSLRTGGVHGTFSSEQALARLLAGSGLSYRFTTSSTVTIMRPDAARMLADASAGSVALEEIIVQGKANRISPSFAGGQVARGGRVGILGNKDYMDTPFSVSSYTDKTIRDQQAQSAAEVLTNSDPSVRASIGSTNRYDALTIRGFRIENSDFALNGLYGLVADYRVNPAPIERIEILRGPGAFLNGISPSGGIGGSVNVVTKQALDEPLTRFTTFYLSNSRAGEQFDISRRYGDQKQLGIRVNGTLIGGTTVIDRQSSQNGGLSFAADYQGEHFRLYEDVIYQNDAYTAQSRGYLPLTGIKLPSAPDPRINVAQDFDYAKARSLTELTRGEYDLTSNVMAFGAIGFNRFSYGKREAPGATLLDANGNASSTSTFQTGQSRAVSGEAGVRVRFDTGPVKHEVVVTGTSLEQTFLFGQTLYGNYATNIYAPILLDGPGRATGFTPLSKSNTSRFQSVGIADTLSILDNRVQLTLGGRRQQITQNNFDPTGALSNGYDSGANSPSVALVLRPTREISFYGNFVEGLTVLTPPSGVLNPNQVFPPTKSTQYEIGTKLDLGRIGATLALFQITQPAGTVDPVTRLFALSGEQRNRGIEFNMFGEVRPWLRVLGGVTLLDPRLTKTAGNQFDGNFAVGAPRLQSNVAVEYDTPFVRGLTAIGRVIYTSRAFASQDNLQSVPDWTTLDLGLRYTTIVAAKPVVFRATVANVLDNKYFIANPTGYLISGPPRTVLLSMQTDF